MPRLGRAGRRRALVAGVGCHVAGFDDAYDRVGGGVAPLDAALLDLRTPEPEAFMPFQVARQAPDCRLAEREVLTIRARTPKSG